MAEEPQVQPQGEPQNQSQGTPAPSEFLAGSDGTLTSDWLSRLNVSDEIKADKNLQGITDINQLAEQFSNAQKLIGKKTINKIPGQDATEEERQSFFRELGVPDNPEKYELNTESVPEGAELDENLLNNFKDTAHKLNMTPDQAQGLMDWFHQQTGQSLQEAQQQNEQQKQEAMQALKQEWGRDFDKNLQVANRLVDKYELSGILDQEKLSNSPDLAKALNQIAKDMGEDQNINTPKGSGISAQDAKAKADEIMGDASHPYWNGQHPSHEAAVQDMQKLMSIIHGE